MADQQGRGTAPRRRRIWRGQLIFRLNMRLRPVCQQEMERAIKAGRPGCCWAGAMCRMNRDMPVSPTAGKGESILRQVFIGRGADVIDAGRAGAQAA